MKSLTDTCFNIAGETASKQENHFQEKATIEKKRREVESILKENRNNLSRIILKSVNSRTVLDNLLDDHKKYLEVHKAIENKNTKLMKEVEYLKENTVLDQQLEKLISSKQFLNEKL